MGQEIDAACKESLAGTCIFTDFHEAQLRSAQSSLHSKQGSKEVTPKQMLLQINPGG